MNTYKFVLFTAFILPMFISSCDTSNSLDISSNNTIIFQPTYHGKAVNCTSKIKHSNKHWHYSQLQFYISAIALKNSRGEWQKTELIKSPFQTEYIALIGEHCNLGNTKNKSNWQLNIAKHADLNNFSHIRFDIGLPFDINHLNPLTQESPLNVPNMFWGWQKGHKFLRLEMLSDTDNWLFHLGSTGCFAQSPLRAPKKECRYPNRKSFELALNKAKTPITFDLAKLLNNVILQEQTSCQSSPENTSCQTLFNNLNSKGEQSVFQLNTSKMNHE